MNAPEVSAIGLQLLLLLMHWGAFVALFSASAALYRLVVSDDADQHRMFQGLAQYRISLWCWLFLACSGAGLVWIGQYPAMSKAAELATTSPDSAAVQMLMLKTALAVLAFLISLVPWRFMRRHAVVRSYGWVNVPQHVRWCLRIELFLILLVMAVAVVIRVSKGLPIG